MPKIKTHKGAAKRVKITPRGKALRRHAYSNHNFTKKDKDRKREYSKPQSVIGKEKHTVKQMLGG